MNRENFFRKYDKIIKSFGEAKPSILLHSCCGPCSSSVIELLAQHFEVTVLWYNRISGRRKSSKSALPPKSSLYPALPRMGFAQGF